MSTYNKMPKKNQWKIMYLLLLRKAREIHSVFPIEILGERFNNFEEYLEKSEVNKAFQNSFYFSIVHIDSKEFEWLMKQKKKFDNGTLNVDKIKKLKLLGLYKNSIGFSEEDEYIFDIYFKNIDDLVEYNNYTKEDNWQLKVTKYIVKNYYYRKESQKYDMSDYIETIFEEVIDSTNNNKKIEFVKLERKILSKISKLNEPAKIEEIDLENVGYKIDNLIDLDFLKKHISNILNNYDERTRKIIKYRFGIVDEENNNLKPYSLEECAKKFGISYERIRQIEEKALRDIRRRNYEELKDYVDFKTLDKKGWKTEKDLYYDKLYNGLKDYEKLILTPIVWYDSDYLRNIKREVINFFIHGYANEGTLSLIESIVEKTNNRKIIENKDIILRQIQYARSIQNKIKPKYM